MLTIKSKPRLNDPLTVEMWILRTRLTLTDPNPHNTEYYRMLARLVVVKRVMAEREAAMERN